MDVGGPELAGVGGREVLDWAALQKSAAKSRDVVLVGQKERPRLPFVLVQIAEAEGVEFQIGTFTGGTESGRHVRPASWRMPEGPKRCLIDFEGRRWECWTGGLPPPGKGEPPSRDGPPGGIADAPSPQGPPPGGSPDPPGGAPPGPGPGPGPQPESPPPAGDPPGRAPDPPAQPPPPAGPGVPPEGGQPPPGPGPEDPPKQPPPAPPSQPPEGGGDKPPPEPEPPKEKPPKYEPDPEPAQKSEQESIQEDPSSHLIPLASESQLSTFSVFGRAPSFMLSTGYQWPSELAISGSFNIGGVLKSGSTCCVMGELSTVSFDESSGIGIEAAFGSLEVVVSYFTGINRTATTEIDVCLPGDVIARDTAVIEAEIEWQLTVLARASLVEYRLGPITALAGMEVGFRQADVSVGNGTSNLADFDVGESFQTSSGLFGYFGGLRCELAGMKVGITFDVALTGFGDMSWSHDLMSLYGSIGIGF